MLIAHHKGVMRFEWTSASGARRWLAPLAIAVLGGRLAFVLVRHPRS
jgi:hypothetical protein